MGRRDTSAVTADMIRSTMAASALSVADWCFSKRAAQFRQLSKLLAAIGTRLDMSTNFSLFIGRQATGRRQADSPLRPNVRRDDGDHSWFALLYSLDEVKRFTARFICRSFSSA